MLPSNTTLRHLMLTGLALLVLSACSTTPQRTMHAASAKVSRIAVLPAHVEERFAIALANDQWSSLDLFAPLPVGSAVSLIAGRARSAEFNEALSASPSDYAALWDELVGQSISRAGLEYEVVPLERIDSQARRKKGLLKNRPDGVPENVDAVLETALTVGFMASARGKPYRPMLHASLRLIGVDGQLLMQDRILFNPPVDGVDGIRIQVPAGIEFADIEAITSSAESDAALRLAVNEAVAEVGYLLSEPWQ